MLRLLSTILIVGLTLTVMACEEGEEAATATPSPPFTPAASPEATPTPEATATPIVFNKGDTELAFHVDADSFELGWTVTGSVGFVDVEVLRQEEDFDTLVCSANNLREGSGSTVCISSAGDFRLFVQSAGDVDWSLRITPQ